MKKKIHHCVKIILPIYQHTSVTNRYRYGNELARSCMIRKVFIFLLSCHVLCTLYFYLAYFCLNVCWRLHCFLLFHCYFNTELCDFNSNFETGTRISFRSVSYFKKMIREINDAKNEIKKWETLYLFYQRYDKTCFLLLLFFFTSTWASIWDTRFFQTCLIIVNIVVGGNFTEEYFRLKKVSNIFSL